MADIVRRGDYPLSSWDPFRMMREMLRFDPFFRDMSRGDREVWMPNFEVRENGNAIKLAADLPGAKREDVDINVTGNTLTITGKREAEERSKDEHVHYYERSFGQFSRSFTLPEYADVDHITSSLQDGVLMVVIPKAAQTKSRKIQIGSGSKH